MLWSQGRYVGVFSRINKIKTCNNIDGDWQLHCYHDSCWRGQDGLDQILSNIEDNVWGFWFRPWEIVDVNKNQQEVFKKMVRR